MSSQTSNFLTDRKRNAIFSNLAETCDPEWRRFVSLVFLLYYSYIVINDVSIINTV